MPTHWCGPGYEGPGSEPETSPYRDIVTSIIMYKTESMYKPERTKIKQL